MAHNLTAALLVCLAGALVTPASSGAAVRQPCRAPGKLVSASASAAITVTPSRTFYGCVRGRPARRLVNDDILGGAKGGVATGAPTLAGSRAGWVFEYCDRGGCEVRAEVRNLRTGRRVAAKLTGFPEVATVRVGLTSRGVLVFSRSTPDGGEIAKLSVSGDVTTLAAGAVDPASLAVGGGRAYWIAAGQPATVVL
jgi:hypothetical protein